MTPVGTPKDTDAKTELYFETFFSAPYSAKNPNVPTLQIKITPKEIFSNDFKEYHCEYSLRC